jgi:competence protein ComEA
VIAMLRGISEQVSGRLAHAWHVVRRAASFSIQGSSGVARRLRGSAWAMPLLKVGACGAGLFLLAWLGQRATAHAIPPAEAAPVASVVAALPTTTTPDPPASNSPIPSARASPEGPVILNTATIDDLERLPGIGPKRAKAILDQRARQGRFRQIEDLMKVKGIGRTTIKRLRPLVRVDPPEIKDASSD